MTSIIRAASVTGLIVLGVIPSIGGRTQAPSALIATRSGPTQTATATNEVIAPIGNGKKSKSGFADDGPVDTAWPAQIESFWHGLVRLRVASVLSSSSPSGHAAAALPNGKRPSSGRRSSWPWWARR